MSADMTTYTPIAARGGETIFDYEYKWSKRMYPLVRQTIAPYILKESPILMDMHEATDILTNETRVAVRCRHHTNLLPISRKKSPYRTAYTFMIRSKRKSGNITELAKIMQGYGTHFFYGYVSKDETYFLAWWLLNLDIFRSEYSANKDLGFTTLHQDNTETLWFDIRRFPGSLVIAGTHLPGKGYI